MNKVLPTAKEKPHTVLTKRTQSNTTSQPWALERKPVQMAYSCARTMRILVPFKIQPDPGTHLCPEIFGRYTEDWPPALLSHGP